MTTTEPARTVTLPPVFEDIEGETLDAPAHVPVDAKVKKLKPTVADRIAGEKRRPILPPWLKNTGDFKAAAKWAAGHYWHASRFHAAHSPIYLGRVLKQAPVGAGKSIKAHWGWLRDREGAPLRVQAAANDDPEVYLRLRKYRDGRVSLRLAVSAITAALGAGAVIALYVLGDAWMQVTAGIILTCVFGAVGSPEDKPLLSPAVVKPQVRRLTSGVVLRALAAIGNSPLTKAITKNTGELSFPQPIAMDGPGWLAKVELPYGVTATDVIEKRERLASGLRRPLGCVWPSAVPEEHEGMLELFVGNETMSKAKQQPWPLLEDGQVDLFKPFPFGTNPRGRIVQITLMFASMIIGSIPRMGKTFAMRLIALACALDPRAALYLFDLKGTGDFSSLEPVCHAYRAGDDADDIKYALGVLRELHAELKRRTKVINGLPSDICPENKVTPFLAGQQQYGLHPIVVGADECQRWFEHKKHGEEIEEICEDLVKRGPALGIIAMFGTQRPDASSLPTGISANAVLRFCLKVMGWLENNMVLGDGMYKAGIQATMFARSERGIGYLAGEGDDPQIVRTFYIDNDQAKVIIRRARKYREEAGTITGHAADTDYRPDAAEPTYDLLKDVLKVVPAGEAKVWNERIAARLQRLNPSVYGGWTGETVTLNLKPLGVTTKDVAGVTDDGKRTTRRGVDRADVADAVAARNQARV